MDLNLLQDIEQLNPWFQASGHPIINKATFVPRTQITELLDPEWDAYWTVLMGPRRAGKTTLGKYLAEQLLEGKRYPQLLYLNCDYRSIREWLSSPSFISQAQEQFSLETFILFIDEVQRIENPGLLLKAIIDLGLPLKCITTGSSQLEIKSKVQEYLTGRQFTSIILPFSCSEWNMENELDEILVYGCYPQVLKSSKKESQLREIYNSYVQKDIIEILKIGKSDIFQQLITLIAHGSGQLVNYNQLASDCKVSVTIVRNYLNIMEQTFLIVKVTPFVGNKRAEVTSNPMYYFIDNGFRNIALRNFSSLPARNDAGLLVENFVFQEIYKFKTQHYLSFDIHYWRTKSGAEVDFVLFKNTDYFLPIEVKYRSMNKPTVSRGFRSFIEAYRPKKAIYITKDLISTLEIDDCVVHFIPLKQLSKLFELIDSVIR